MESNGITITQARHSFGQLYVEFSIRTDACAGCEHYRYQYGQKSCLWTGEQLLGEYAAAEMALQKILRRVHVEEQRKMTVREFVLFVDGWIAGQAK